MRALTLAAMGFGLAMSVANAWAGTIVGLVRAHAPAPPHESAAGGYGSLKYKFAETINYDRLEDFVVYLNQPVPGAQPSPPMRMAQRLVAFEPHVLVVPVGTHVSWPNDDAIYHNVFSMSEAASFDLGMRTDKDPAADRVFDRPGRIDVFCSIHAKMHGIVLVVPSPFFAKVGARHPYRLEHVPAGTYPIRAWHERLPAAEQQVVVPAEGTVTVNFELGLESLSKP